MHADLLCNVRFYRYFGSRLTVLLPSVMAFFACLSAFSLPLTSLCPEIHLRVIVKL